jgi:PAS domain S-box-containing protein
MSPMPCPTPALSAPASRATTALLVVDHISAMVAYWDASERCVFANAAYRSWFGKSPAEMQGMSLRDLLGAPLYEKNLPYIRGALAGRPQIFERQIPLPDGTAKNSIATYTPEVADGVVRGFSVHVADVTELRQREIALAGSIRNAIRTIEKTKESFRSKELGQLRQQLMQTLAHLMVD